METRYQNSPAETAAMDSEALQQNFLVKQLFMPDQVKMVYSHYDRLIIGGALPLTGVLKPERESELRSDYFLERRELGIINVGGNGSVEADGQLIELNKLDCLYLGKGVKSVSFISENSQSPAMFYFLSAPAHQSFPVTKMAAADAQSSMLGEPGTSNKRTIFKYIHAAGIRSAQLVMGLTVLEPGSVWNTMPAHTHTRRTEAYFYFDLPEEQRVFHFMGEPQQTRHIIVANLEAVISPPWSIHSGCGTSNYGFIWGMAGENLDYADMDAAPLKHLR